MAADPRSYLTAGIIIGVFSLVALFGGIAIPLIEKSKLYDTITNDQMLTREQSLAWATVPGTRNINYQKTFTIFNLSATSDEILQGKVDAQPLMNATYDYTYQYSKLQFTPGTNGSVQYFNIYNHTYLGANEADLANLKVNTVDMGVFRGITQLANISPAQAFVQSLHRIFTSFQEIYTMLVCDYVHDFYIKDKNLTYQTIFLYANTVTPAQADQLWSDSDYGWQSSSTLLPWVSIALNNNGNPTANPLYLTLKSRFGLTDAQMTALAAGQYAQSSLLVGLATAVQSTISGANSCGTPNACTNIELFCMQILQGILTNNPAFKGVQPQASIADYNQTLPTAPEITAVNPQNVSFQWNLYPGLFNLNSTTGLPTGDQQTLFNILNIEFILANQNNPQAVANYSNLDNAQQGQVMIDWVNYIINQFTYEGQSNMQATKFMADSAVKNVNNLVSDMGSLFSVNLTALGTYNLMKSQNYNCTYLLQNVSLPQAQIDTICANPDYTLDSAQGQAPWVAAYFASEGSNVWNSIENATGIPDAIMQSLVAPSQWTPNSQFVVNVQTILNAMVTSVGCVQTPCDSGFLGSLQWATSGVTSKLPTQYFTQVESMVDLDIFKAYFGDFIPEFPVSAKRNQGVNLTLTQDQGNTLLGYGVGSINNNYELFRLVNMYQSANYTGIQSRYNFTQAAVGALLYYFDNAFMNYYMKGLHHQISAHELLWGYSSDFLVNLNSSNFFDILQLFDPEISLYGSKENTDEDSDAPFNMIDSGSDNSNNVRQMTNYNGNGTLALNYTYYNGNITYSSYEPVWNGDLQYVSGSDGSGFSPLMNEGDSIAIFEGPFLRNLNYKYQSQITKEYNSKSYDFNQYEFDTSQLSASKTYLNNLDGYMNLTGFDNTPIVVSLPYFKSCAASSYSSITFNNQSAANYQANVDAGTFSVEALTGLTDSFTKSYQYNAYNSMPFFFTKTNNLAAIPLFQVTETFTIPQSNYESDLQSYYSSLRAIKIAMIVVLVIAFLLMVTAGVMFRMYFVNRKKLDASRLNANPGDYASLGVDSDGARSSLHPLTQG